MSTNQTYTRYTIWLWAKKKKTKREGSIGRHFPGGQNWPRPNMLPDDPEEDLILKSILTTPNPIIVPFYEAPVFKFHMWLVQNGIANLVLVPRIEK